MTTVNNRKVSPPLGIDEDQKETGFLNRPLPGGKSRWDWLNLFGILLIPLVVAVATLWFSIQQAQNSLDQQRAAILQTYIDNIQDLLLNHHLLEANLSDTSNPYYDVAVLARARTLTALQGLDPERQGVLLNFLHEAKLIGQHDFKNGGIENGIIDLNGANLNGADLSGADLSDSDLTGVSLIGADLSNADLNSANLNAANLNSANLNGANLSAADIGFVFNLTQQQLDQVGSCLEATLPSGLTCHRNYSPHGH